MTGWAWGAMRVGGGDTSTPADLAQFLNHAHRLGARWIDCADIYGLGASDSAVGAALTHDPSLRERFRIIAKAGVVWQQGGVHTKHYSNDPAYLRRQLTGSLQRLGLDQVDLFLVHRPDYLLDANATAEALNAMVTDGLAKAVGVSNFSAPQTARLNRALGQPVAADQLELSPLALDALDDGRLDQNMMEGTGVFAWSPLAGGQLFNPESEAAHRVRAALARLAGSDNSDAIAGAALAWVARHPANPVPILGTTRLDRLTAQVQAMERLSLSAADWYAVLEASRGGELA